MLEHQERVPQYGQRGVKWFIVIGPAAAAVTAPAAAKCVLNTSDLDVPTSTMHRTGTGAETYFQHRRLH